jgi:hypothetical protein
MSVTAFPQLFTHVVVESNHFFFFLVLGVDRWTRTSASASGR